ncbi:hypothetical protein DL770_009629 [Monosporascus sp. CRB-9-2]|nr:hypothetical protein DL770_009629 [Monosporascus sp. CRB-9-2]
MSSFFTVPGSGKKRKRPTAPTGSEATKKRRATTSKATGKGHAKAAPAPKKQQKAAERDESISGSDSDDDADHGDQLPDHAESGDESDASDTKDLTAAERRLRLAEKYLANVRQEVDEHGFDAADLDKDLIAERLQEDVAEAKGRVYRNLSTELNFDNASQCIWKWNSGVITSIAACGPHAYTASRDLYLTKFKIQDLPRHQWPQTTKKKQKKPQAPPKRRPERVAFRKGNPKKAKDRGFKGHTDAILSVAVSHDGKFVATGGEDSRIVLWDAEKLMPLKTFFHHRDAVTGLAWRKGTHQLFSSSKDRTVKVWSMDEQAYVDTLYGHQDSIVDIDALAQERCVTVGSRDRTARLWKVVEETQSIFRGGSADKKAKQQGMDPKSLASEGSIDRVAMIDEQLFVSGGDSGSICLWSIEKKKPLFILQYAHGFDPPLKPTAASAEENPDPSVVPPPQPRWITALRTIPYTDIVLSGSWEGCVRIWRLSADKKRLEAVGVLGKDPDGRVPSVGDEVNGDQEERSARDEHAADKPIKGIINDIAAFERGERGADGLSVVCAIGKEHRLGRWQHKIPGGGGGRNGGVVFEIPRLPPKAAANGAVQSDDEEGDS